MQSKHAGTAHALEWLDDGVALRGDERAQDLVAGSDQRRRAHIGEPGRGEFLVEVPQSAGAVVDRDPRVLGLLQQVGRVDVVHVERRVLAHQDRVEVGQRTLGHIDGRMPVALVVAHLDDPHPRMDPAILEREVVQVDLEQFPAP